MESITRAVRTVDQSDIFDAAWVPGSHLNMPLKKAMHAIKNKQGFVICGDSGLGKSSLANQIRSELLIIASQRQRNPTVYSDIPVLGISLQKRSKLRIPDQACH